MTGRERILAKLKAARQPFTDIQPPAERLPVVAQLPDEDLVTCFKLQAEALACRVALFDDTPQALEHILGLLEGQTVISAWDFAHIPLPGLPDALNVANIEISTPRGTQVQIGITGVDVALAATGSIVLLSGPGKGREVSLLPYTHIAVLQRSRIVRDLETWLSAQRQNASQFMEVSKYNIISGPSRTADIAMQLVMGAHGPAELHVVIV
ncbi:MAG: lactate utilization protein C [Chloroflexi bacterium]|nr:lactate utilization protein C [Chloroflexota bacterium]